GRRCGGDRDRRAGPRVVALLELSAAYEDGHAHGQYLRPVRSYRQCRHPFGRLDHRADVRVDPELGFQVDHTISNVGRRRIEDGGATGASAGVGDEHQIYHLEAAPAHELLARGRREKEALRLDEEGRAAVEDVDLIGSAAGTDDDADRRQGEVEATPARGVES